MRLRILSNAQENEVDKGRRSIPEPLTQRTQCGSNRLHQGRDGQSSGAVFVAIPSNILVFHFHFSTTSRSRGKYGNTSIVVVFLRVAANTGIDEEDEEAAADGNGAVDTSLWHTLSAISS